MGKTTQQVLDAYVKWITGAPLLPSVFPPCDAHAHICSGDDVHTDGFKYECLDPARLIIASFVFHIIQLLVLSAIFDRFTVYRKLKVGHKLYWLSSGVGIIHALVSTWGGISYGLDFDYYTDDITKQYLAAEMFTAYSVGYFIYDFLLLCILWFLDKESRMPSILIHHCFAIFTLPQTFIMAKGTWFVSFWLLTEGSSPFVNLRWMFTAAGLRNHWSYTVNAVLILLSFTLFRMVQLAVFWFLVFMRHQEVLSLGAYGLAVSMGPGLLGSSLNIYWYGKIVRGAIRILKGGSEDNVEEKKNQ